MKIAAILQFLSIAAMFGSALIRWRSDDPFYHLFADLIFVTAAFIAAGLAIRFFLEYV